MKPDPGLLTVVILTLNEERHLSGCLVSLALLGATVLVVDSGSTDATLAIARSSKAHVVQHRFAGYASQRQYALGLVRTRWTLFLDADERLTPQLGAEILGAIGRGDHYAGYWIPRANWFGRRRLRGGGWWPDRQLRLVRTERASMHAGREVHETIDLDGATADFTHPLVHLNYDTLAEFRDKQRRYARIRAEVDGEGDTRVPARRFVAAPIRELRRRFVELGGYRDRGLGLALASILAWYELRYWMWTASAARASDPVAQTLSLAEEDPTLDVSIIIVSYNVLDKLTDCLESLDAWKLNSALRAEVIVVDNASMDGTPAFLAERFPAVRVIAESRNLGFAAGCNIGLRQAAGKTIILLNPDTEVIGDAFDVLHRFLISNPGVGVVGPRLLYPDGTTQPSRRRFPNFLTGLLESTLAQDVWHNNAVLRRYYVADRSDDLVQDVDWLVGACLVTAREVLLSAGLLDERFFMFSEEVEWCHRIRRAGWRIVYQPEATVVHFEGASSGQDVPRRQVEFDTSKVMLFRLLYGGLSAELLRAYLLGTYALRIIVEGSKGLIGHKSALRWARVRLYWRGLRSGLRPGDQMSGSAR